MLLFNIVDYAKLKRKYNRLLKKYKESEETIDFLFNENKILKTKLRGNKDE